MQLGRRSMNFMAYYSAARGIEMRETQLKDVFSRDVEGLGPTKAFAVGAQQPALCSVGCCRLRRAWV